MCVTDAGVEELYNSLIADECIKVRSCRIRHRRFVITTPLTQRPLPEHAN
jgi:hypothetical protein